MFTGTICTLERAKNKMALICYSGLPGKGKTGMATYDAVKKFKRDNSLFTKGLYLVAFKLTKKERFNPIYPRVLVYSNYPILLHRKKKIYSHKVGIDDLKMIKKFPEHSMIIFDETQRYYDSREFSKFPKEIGTFMQHHRHGSIDDIILVTQHPKRLDNKMRDLCEVYRKFRIFVKIPLIPYIFTYYTNYYESDFYGMYHHADKKNRNYDYDNHFRIFALKNCFPRYNSKYFHFIFDNLPLVEQRSFTDIDLTEDDLSAVGIKF